MKGYRTILLNIATAVVGVAVAADWTGTGMSTQTAGMVMTGLGIANTVLRFFTTTSVGKAE